MFTASRKMGLAVLVGMSLAILTCAAYAEDIGSAPAPAYSTNPSNPPSTSGTIPLKAIPIGPQKAPDKSVPATPPRRFEQAGSLPRVLRDQFSLASQVPPESIISESYLRTRDTSARSMTLKEAIYLALKNNPGIEAASLDPLASLESLRQANAVFDPDLTSRIDESKTVIPTTSVLQTGGATAFVQKTYDWNFAASKLLSSTNGTLGINFDNNRQLSNSAFSALNPSYTPGLTISLSQPLLRSFGIDLATINVRIARENQKQAQFTYEQDLSDFVLRVASDYWNVVGAEENLQVARNGLKLAQDLVRQNEISVRVGVLAPISIREAQSEAATREAQLYQVEGTLETARAVLRQDVMLNPAGTFLPASVEPADRPNPEIGNFNEEQSLELAMQYRPELASMRESIRALLLEVKNAQNATLPMATFGGQFGVTATAGTAKTTSFGTTPLPKLPFGGIYGDALNRLWGFSFYNYAVALNFERPFSNDASQAALAQTKIEYEQARLRYRDSIGAIVVDVQRAMANLKANARSAHAAKVATDYAAESLRAEQERFRVGMATTHELLQFQDSLISAQGNQVSAEIALEISKAEMEHATGTLLRTFNIQFEPEEPNVSRWYDKF